VPRFSRQVAELSRWPERRSEAFLRAASPRTRIGVEIIARPGIGKRPGGRGGSGGLLADLDALELGVGYDELPYPPRLAVLLVPPDLEKQLKLLKIRWFT
jgi:hypothetical protein